MWVPMVVPHGLYGDLSASFRKPSAESRVPRNTAVDSTHSAATPHDAPAKTPRHSAPATRSRSTSPSSLPANLRVRTDRGRGRRKQVCEKWTLTTHLLIPCYLKIAPCFPTISSLLNFATENQ